MNPISQQKCILQKTHETLSCIPQNTLPTRHIHIELLSKAQDFPKYKNNSNNASINSHRSANTDQA